MLRPELASSSTAFAQEVERIALPLRVPGAAASRDFSALFGEVRGEVADFIAHGSSGMGSFALTAEGSIHHARLQDASPRVERDQQQGFLASVAPWAREAADRLGVSPELVAAHAALESGWGQRPLRGADGGSTHNLFGIKAGGSWTGDAVRALTTEFEDGVANKQQHDFRSYADESSAFRDYASLLLDNPRYRAALNAGDDAQAFALGLARGSYATDPAYAHKLERVARQVRDLGLPAAARAGSY